MADPVMVEVKCPKCGQRIRFKPVPNYRSRTMTCPKCQYKDTAGNFVTNSNSGPNIDEITDPVITTQSKNIRLKCLDTGESHSLSIGRNTIGRKVSDPRATITFNDPDRFMGRLHASITVAQTPQGVQLHLKDENSANGTFVKNMRINANSVIKLLPGEEIKFGKLRFHCLVEARQGTPMEPLQRDDSTTM